MSYSWEHGERRGSGRFPIDRSLVVKSIGRKPDTSPCQGKTINMSSTGVLFSTEEDFSPGKRVELAISWPAQLNETCPLKLLAKGRVVRASRGTAALEIQQYEFRTCGSSGLSN